MADQKITQLTELLSASSDDLLAIVDDPGGSPETKKITRANFVLGLLQNIVEDTTPQLGGDLDANGFNVLINTNTGINDSNDNEQLLFQLAASAVNYFQMINAATGDGIKLNALGDDTNIDMELSSKGTGQVLANSFDVIASNENFFETYDTSTQTVSTANVFQNVTFGTNALLNGWTHSASSADFTCNQTGIYEVAVSAHIQKSGGGSSFGEFRFTNNGTEIAGTAMGDDLTTNNEVRSIGFTKIISLTTGDVFRLQFTGNTTNTQIVNPGGNATVDVNISMCAHRIQ